MSINKRFSFVLLAVGVVLSLLGVGCSSKAIPVYQVGLKQPQFLILSVLDIKPIPKSPNPYKVTVEQPHSFTIYDHRQGPSSRNPGMVFSSNPYATQANSPCYNRQSWPVIQEPSGTVTHSDSVTYYEKFYSSEYDSGYGRPNYYLNRQIRGYRTIEQRR